MVFPSAHSCGRIVARGLVWTLVSLNALVASVALALAVAGFAGALADTSAHDNRVLGAVCLSASLGCFLGLLVGATRLGRRFAWRVACLLLNGSLLLCPFVHWHRLGCPSVVHFMLSVGDWPRELHVLLVAAVGNVVLVGCLLLRGRTVEKTNGDVPVEGGGNR
jgi:hypothetical protein